MDFLSHACDLGQAGEVFCEAAHIAVVFLSENGRLERFSVRRN
jgi:hypothetical protein